MLRKFFFVVMAMIAFSTTAEAAAPGEWTPSGLKISQIIIEGDTALIKIEGGVPSAYIPSQCNSELNTVDLNTVRGKNILALATVAKVSGITVSLVLGSCYGLRPLMTYIAI